MPQQAITIATEQLSYLFLSMSIIQPVSPNPICVAKLFPSFKVIHYPCLLFLGDELMSIGSNSDLVIFLL